MQKTPLATQIPVFVKKRLDALCEDRGLTLSHVITEALQEKIDQMLEEEALVSFALERLAEPGGHTYKDYKKFLKSLK